MRGLVAAGLLVLVALPNAATMAPTVAVQVPGTPDPATQEHNELLGAVQGAVHDIVDDPARACASAAELFANPQFVLWTKCHMGAGSGLDADLLHGVPGSWLVGEVRVLREDLSAEVGARVAADQALGARITAEVALRADADAALLRAVQQEAQSRAGAVDHLTGRITAEVAARLAAIGEEALARQLADQLLGGRLDGLLANLTREIADRLRAIEDLAERITREALERLLEDRNLSRRIDDLRTGGPAAQEWPARTVHPVTAQCVEPFAPDTGGCDIRLFQRTIMMFDLAPFVPEGTKEVLLAIHMQSPSPTGSGRGYWGVDNDSALAAFEHVVGSMATPINNGGDGSTEVHTVALTVGPERRVWMASLPHFVPGGTQYSNMVPELRIASYR